MSTPANTDWIKSPVGGSYFRYVDGEQFVRFPAVGTVPELIISFPIPSARAAKWNAKMGAK
jgi:hypothetical protein